MKNSSDGTAPASTPSVTCTPAIIGHSTLAELNAIKVTKGQRLDLYIIIYPFSFACHI
jgi:hypothetical protein